MTTDSMWESAWLGWGWRSVAGALRAAAAALESLAGWLEGEQRHPFAAESEALPPLAGTRAQIAAALDRARSRYEVVTSAVPASKAGPRQRPRRAKGGRVLPTKTSPR